MKRLIVAMAALLMCMAGCQKEKGILYLETENYTAQGAKMHLDGSHYSVWDDGDSILINGEIRRVSISDGKATIMNVSPELGIAVLAGYPASFLEHWYMLPQVQHYRTNASGQVLDAPMIAVSEDISEEVLKFQNLGSVFSIVVDNETGSSLNVLRIEVEDENGGFLSGSARVAQEEDGSYYLTRMMIEDESFSQVALDCGSGVRLASGASQTFHIYLPVVSGARITIRVYDDYYCYTRTQPAGASTSFARSSIHQVTFSTQGLTPVQYRPHSTEILYTTVDGAPITSSMSPTSNTYQNGVGVMKFAFPLFRVPEQAFCENASLKTVILPSNIQSIGDQAFMRCSSLETVDMPGVTAIGGEAFAESGIQHLDLPNVATIGPRAFARCAGWDCLKMPSATEIGPQAFAEWSLLEELELPQATTVGDSAFYNCPLLRWAKMPSVATVGKRAFYSCEAFWSAELGPQTQYIGLEAFEGCMDILQITCMAQNPPATGGDVASESNLYRIYIPTGRKEAYIADEESWWYEVRSKIEDNQ